MMILAPRRAGMTPAAFRTYVTEVHGPLVRSVTEVASEIRQYHYHFAVQGAADPFLGHRVADLDLISAGTFDSRDAQLRNMQHERFHTVLRPDEQNFADTARAVMHYTDAHELVAGAQSNLKVFYLRRRSPHLTRTEFQDRWLSEGAERLLRSIPADLVVRYQQHHVQAEEHHVDGSDPKYYDVIDELSLAGDAAPAAAGHIDAALRAIEQDTHDTSRTRAFVATVVVNIA